MGETGRDAGHGYNGFAQMAFLAEVFLEAGWTFIRKQIIGCGLW